ncbi:MAG: hypothetical protein DCC67_10820 [Planctomycetota bacterium]|nr:MAG: hypothetical protein DCC67_10820 [Planctomycetota bacterium]
MNALPWLRLSLVTCILSGTSLLPGRDPAAGEVSFVRDVAPILAAKCQSCHGPELAESSYRLDSYDALMRPGDHGTAPVTAGSVDDSEVYRLIAAEDPDERMPANGDRLTPHELATVAAWINGGAKFDGADARAPLREIILRDGSHPAAPASYPFPIPVTALAFTPDGSQLVVGGYHELLLFDPSTGALRNRIANMPQRVHGIALSNDGRWLVVAGGAPGLSGEVRLIRWDNGSLDDRATQLLAASDDVMLSVAFRPDGKEVAAGGADGSVRLFDIDAAAQRLKIDHHADWVNAMQYSPDGKAIATGSRDKTAKVCDAASGALLAAYSDHEARVRSVAFTPDGACVISAGGAHVRQWKLADSTLVGEFTGAEKEVLALTLAGETLIAGGADSAAKAFKAADRSLVKSLAGHPSWILALAWSPASGRLAAGCFDGTVVVWRSDTWEQEARFAAAPLQAAAAPTQP